MLSTLYRLATDLGAPFIAVYLRRRRAAGREDAERFQERFGHPSLARPAGRLAWCHAASVGEAASLMLLIEKIHDIYPNISILLTTGTVTAARMIAPRLPRYAVHQYVPIDRAPCIERFLKYWQPMLAILIESELWPNTLMSLQAGHVPTILLNARMSDKSFRSWHRAKGFARQLMSGFCLCLAQTENDRGRFIALGASPVKYLGNLKYASAPLPCDTAELANLQAQIGNRPVWVMASTHRGEEEMAFIAHKNLHTKHDDIVTVIAPRHAVRGDEIAQLLTKAGIVFARRSKNEPIKSDTQIYLADTMGELGLFYRLCPIVVLGGSFVRIGGHNPIEPAQLGATIIFGAYMYNFTEIAREFSFANAAIQLKHDNEIAFTVERLLTQPEEREKYAHAASLLADQKRYILDQYLAAMEPWLRNPSVIP